MTRLHANDESLAQRVIGHVLQSASDGVLPQLAWHEGLSAAERHALHLRWPLPCALWEELGQRPRPTGAFVDHSGLLRPLRSLLSEHRVNTDPSWTALANALACACFGSHHLWVDLGLSGREEVSHLLQSGFPALHAGNRHNLRWKRHLFIVLGDQLGHSDLHPPKCDGCDNQGACFGGNAVHAAGIWPLTPLR